MLYITTNLSLWMTCFYITHLIYLSIGFFCAIRDMHVRIMMDDVYIYHAHTIFPLSLFCVGTHVYSSTSQSQELTKRALESNDDLGSRGLSLPPFPSRKDYAHLFYLALTRLWAIYHLFLYAHTIVFTLHVIRASMPLPCNCDPCLHLPMIHHYATPMCICMWRSLLLLP